METVLLEPRNLKYLYTCWLPTYRVWIVDEINPCNATNVLMSHDYVASTLVVEGVAKWVSCLTCDPHQHQSMASVEHTILLL